MESDVIVRKDSYYDSVFLMRISRELKALEGVDDAVVAMGTPHNRELLAKSGYGDERLVGAGPNDLLIAARAEREVLATLAATVNRFIAMQHKGETVECRPVTLAGALAQHPETNLVLISVPGEHATREARRALRLGRHVMLFSDNVSLEDEVALKKEAVERGLLMMGPDCGTAMVNGMPLAFANVVRRGSIGIVAASGTGAQEVACCIHRLGGGVSQLLGTGGRDLSEAVGGSMTLLGIQALARDPATAVLVVVSKPPSRAVAEKVLTALKVAPKPAVVHFVGAKPLPVKKGENIRFADSLAEAAEQACALAGLPVATNAAAQAAADEELALTLARKLEPGIALRGLFCGGTTGHESLNLLGRAGIEVRSNLHKDGALRVEGDEPVAGHVLLDLGDDRFTQGRPHPMIEPVLRNERLAREMDDPRVGLLLFDLVLGYGAHPDPAGVLCDGFLKARARAEERGRPLVAIASATGTSDDPQNAEQQRRILSAAGIVVLDDNRRAARVAARILTALG